MDAKLITKERHLDELCHHVDRAGMVSLDFEFIPERTYFPVLCLVQACVEGTPYIVDPLALRDLGELWKRVANPEIKCIFHAGSQDLELAYGLSGLVPKNIFDTQIAAGFAGYGYSAGYRKLLNQILDVNIPKTESFSDWQARPLTDAQIDYAVNDVIHLEPLYENILEELERRGRLDWAFEECLHYEEEGTYNKDRSREFFRVKGSNTLTPRGLAILREVWGWRDETARELNKPPRTILADNVLIEVCRRPPASVQALGKMRGIRPDQVRHYGDAILDAVRDGQSVPSDQCPTWPSGRAPSKDELLMGDFIYVILKFLANDLDLAAEHLATRDELQAIVRGYMEGRPERTEDVRLLKGWRFDVAGERIVAMLDGRDIHVKVRKQRRGLKLELTD